MITLLLRLGRYLLKTSEPNVKPDTVVRSQYSDLDEKEDSDFISRKEFFGKVTSIHDGYGLVDNAVYFSFELLGNKQLPGVGNTVLVDARRTSTAEGWVAHSICWVSECWEEGNDNSSPVVIEPKVSGIRKPVVGCITDVTEGGRCYINHDEVIDLQVIVI